MSNSLRHALISIAIVVLAVLAHGRLLQAGWLGDDLRTVRASATESRGMARGWLEDGAVRPLGALVLRSSAAADTRVQDGSGGAAATLRVTAFVVLLAGALLTGFALRRALTPWVGGDTARAAGFACALLVAVHPLAGAALARPRAIGDLLAWAFGALAAFLFLRGRQMRERGWVFAAGIAAVFAGFASGSAWLVPFVLATLEFGSARRPRPMSERLRTAFTTFVAFGACVMVEGALASSLGLLQRRGFAGTLPDLEAWSSPAHAAASCVQKLGLLFFPVTGGTLSSSWPSYIVCIAIVLIALWPALRSARVAPRSWGSLSAAWIAAMLLALVPLAGVHVAPDDGSRADALVIAAAFAAAGLGVAATSLLGTRRIVLPALIAIGLSWLSARNAGNYTEAGAVVTRLSADLAAATVAAGGEGRVLVVDPPTRVAGFDLGTRAIFDTVEGPTAGPPQALPSEAIPFLSRTSEFAEWRKHKIAFLEEGPSTAVPSQVHVVAPTVGTKPPPPWFGESRSSLFDLDPAGVRFARVRALPGTSSAEAPRFAWRASEPAGEWVVAAGVWIEDEKGLVALFDPWRHEAWWTASTIRRVRAEDPLVNVALFELLDDLPLAIEGAAPRVVGPDWVFDVREDTLARPVRGTAQFVFELLAERERGSLEYVRIDCEDAGPNGLRSIRARGAAGAVAAYRGTSGGFFAWSLERRVGEVVVARAGGNRAP